MCEHEALGKSLLGIRLSVHDVWCVWPLAYLACSLPPVGWASALKTPQWVSLWTQPKQQASMLPRSTITAGWSLQLAWAAAVGAHYALLGSDKRQPAQCNHVAASRLVLGPCSSALTHRLRSAVLGGSCAVLLATLCLLIWQQACRMLAQLWPAVIPQPSQKSGSSKDQTQLCKLQPSSGRCCAVLAAECQARQQLLVIRAGAVQAAAHTQQEQQQQCRNAAEEAGAVCLQLPFTDSAPIPARHPVWEPPPPPAQQPQQQQPQPPGHPVVPPGAADVPSPAVQPTTAASAGPPSGMVDVWVLAGQSNCVGTNGEDGQDMPAAAAPWPGRILCFNCNGCWVDAVPNVHLGLYGYGAADSCGPDMAFARSLIHSGTAAKVGLVPTACGGTNLYEQWAPGALLWRNMVDRTAAALEALQGRGRLAGILWIQGESDAFAPEPAAAYSTNFTAWLDATRSTLQPHHPCVPLVMVVMATRQRELAFPFIHVVRQQQWGLKAPALLKVDMQGFEFYPQDEQQQLIHLTKAGCCALGTSAGFQVAVWQAAGQQQQ